MQVLASGTLTPTVGTTHTIYNDVGTGNNIYVVVLDLSNITWGDSVNVEIYTKVLSTGAVAKIMSGSYTGKQIEPLLISAPIPSDLGIQVDVTQTEGTAKSMDWKVLAL